MSTATTEVSHPPVVNGLDTGQIGRLAAKIAEEDAFGKFTFRAHNTWIHGSRSRTEISGFYAGGEERTERTQALTVDADQPAFLAGRDSAPNAVEHLLHSLASCLNTTLVYHASVRGIALQALRISAEGDMNARGFFGISDDVNRGYERIRVHIRARSDADADTLSSLAKYSPVYEVVSRSVPVALRVSAI